MRNVIALLAGIISFTSALPYIYDTARGKTHPNVVTWLTWTLLNAINTIAAIRTGNVQTALLTGFSAAATGSIMAMGIKKASKNTPPSTSPVRSLPSLASSCGSSPTNLA